MRGLHLAYLGLLATGGTLLLYTMRPTRPKGYPSAWSLSIQLRFKDSKAKEEFLSFWAPLARYVRASNGGMW